MNKRNVIIIILVLVFLNVAAYMYQADKTTSTTISLTSVDLSECKLTHLDNGDVEFTVPSNYVGEVTQDDLDLVASENGYTSITLNDSGSATYVMSQDAYDNMIKDLAEGIRSSLSEMPGNEQYSDITSIDVNSDFTDYQVHLATSSADFESSMTVMTLKMYSTMYYAFQGVTDMPVDISIYNKNGDLIAETHTNVQGY